MSSDPMAQIAAEQHVAQLVGDVDEIDGVIVTDEEIIGLNAGVLAAHLVGQLDEVEFERQDGKRRLVLRTAWEVDPAAARTTARAARGAPVPS